jgi:Protein of unknown function (DUF3800)
MAYLLFLDESGHDLKDSPYEVLAGVAVEDRDLWNLICAVQQSEETHFGQRYANEERELKAKRLLKRKVFRHAAQADPIPVAARRELAQVSLQHGATATREQLTALAQAKIAFVTDVLGICERFRCRVFASVVDRDAPRSRRDFLRKDYAYLFERYFYFLEDQDALGLVVFDELERTQSHLLVDQMARYFGHEGRGEVRAGRVVPEPFFVHSHLTTGVQLADLVAYTVAWNVRVGRMTRPRRPELDALGQIVSRLRYRAVREVDEDPGRTIWSIAIIDDLRPRDEIDRDTRASSNQSA